MGIQDRDYMRGRAADGGSRLAFPGFRSKWWRRINVRTALAIAVAAITVISGRCLACARCQAIVRPFGAEGGFAGCEHQHRDS